MEWRQVGVSAPANQVVEQVTAGVSGLQSGDQPIRGVGRAPGPRYIWQAMPSQPV